ncbi:MAG: proton-conducting transporter membrane subunit, partial [Armatimonadota bacterium]
MANIPSQWLLILALGILTVASLLIGLLGRNWRKSGVVAVVSMVAASIATWLLAARVFVLGPVSTSPFLRFDLLGSSLAFHVDRLSAVFLLVVPFVGLAALTYAVEYMAKVFPNRAPGRYYPFALLLLATTIGVVTVSDLFFFFVFWEMMTLVSWVLVWFDREDEQKVHAAWIYFFATHAAAACILIAALLIYSNADSFAFEDVTASVTRIIQSSTILGHLLMSLFLVGFGTKAGMFPLGGWLPKAYSAAPSPASAAFASTMTKLGIYGIARVFFQFLQVPSFRETWGVIIAAFGALSIFFGT